MKHAKRIAAFLVAVWLLWVLPGVAYAREVPDESRTGTITVKMEYDGKPVTGGTLTAYRVARVMEENGNDCFEVLPPYMVQELSWENWNTPELAASFAGQISGDGIAPTTSEGGLVCFEDLKLGLYLIVQAEAADGYEPLIPFLVSVPMNEDGHYVYEVNAEGKFQLHQEPQPTTPPKPSGPNLPQTGQLNWPIPVLAVLGLSLFAAGWILRSGKKKDGYEE